MEPSITEANRLTYRDGFEGRVQEMANKLWPLSEAEAVNGTMKRLDFIQKIDGTNQANNRFTPIVGIDPKHENRWLSTVVNEQAVFVDRKDIHNIIMDPRSSYMREITNAFARRRDDVYIEALGGPVVTGEKGGGTLAYDTTNQQVPAGGVNLDLAKLKATLLILEQRGFIHDTGETPIFAYSPKQKQSLLGIAEAINADFVTKKALIDGMPAMFLGFQFLLTTQLVATDGLGAGLSTSRECYAFAPSAMVTGRGLNSITDIHERQDLTKYPFQLYAYEDVGATRKHDELVVKVLCDETA